MEQHQHYQSLQDQAYNALRSKIIYAELKPGTRLSAIGLEKETGIGRTPIRESFVRLREQELVEKLVYLLSSRYDAGNLYDILRHGLGMDHGDMEALGFQLRDYYEEVE